jgi:hypothetical protein
VKVSLYVKQSTLAVNPQKAGKTTRTKRQIEQNQTFRIMLSSDPKLIEVNLMKMKHIIALCLVLALVLPSTALAASSSHHPAKVNIKVIHTNQPKTVTVYYSLSGVKEKLPHTWNFGDGFTCHCIHRTHIYKRHGTYKISITAKTTDGKTIRASQMVHV